ncbi:MAG: hypothetical protein MAG431_00193 [Chloroflexi bacterium]|nr:hypothetical protein [Chloroflexota bacterium]
MNSHRNNPSIFAPSSFWLVAVLLIVLACGLAVRLFDLTDPPLDYAATRQLRSAMIARGMYYEHNISAPEWKREMAISLGNRSMIEPNIVESVVAGTYLIVGGEHLWIARIYSALYWVLGGVALFFLVKEMVSADGAVIALVYYLLAPFGFIVSRTFIPDPLMTALIVTAWWTFYRWHRTSTWKWAILAGLAAGMAMFVKFIAIFFLLGGMAIVVLMRKKITETLRDGQIWVMMALAALPPLLYTAYGVFLVGTLGQQFQGRFFPQLWGDIKFYLQWKNALATVTGRDYILLVGLIGLIFLKKWLQRGFLLGIWAGYVIYGFGFSYHFMTHYYYHLPAIPLLAISIGALAEYVFAWIRKHKIFKYLAWAGLAAILIAGLVLGYGKLAEDDYRHEPDWYKTVASLVERDASIITLSQNYSYRIEYYGWINPWNWPGTEDFEHAALQGAEPEPFSKRFADYTAGYDYFLVTRMDELKRQEKLYNELYNNYPIYKEGGGFVIFDLRP